MSSDEMDRIVAATRSLGEHFDTVQVFVTRHGPDGTGNAGFGEGSWYARYGQVREWLIREDEKIRREIHEHEA
jgi:hypothetical protein